MSSTALRRKGSTISKPTTTESSQLAIPSAASNVVVHATVRRRKCGTGAFDKHWLNLDCCGLFCAFLTYCLHLYALYTVSFVLLPPWMSNATVLEDESSIRTLTWTGFAHRGCFAILTALAMASHFQAMTTDPGTVPPDAKPIENNSIDSNKSEQDALLLNGGAPPPKRGHRLCRRCKAFKPERAHHCSVCKRCIIKMDHHCPWVNNCVGIGNHKYFLLFIFYTFLTCCYSMTLVIFRFATCVQHHTPHHSHAHGGHDRQYAAATHHIACLDHPTQMLNVLGLLIEGLLFGMFTSCMMFDQSGVVRSKLTHIDRLKGDGADVGGSLAGVVEVFGIGTTASAAAAHNMTRFRWDWISPFCRVRYPASAMDDVMGFCRRVVPTASAPPSTAVEMSLTSQQPPPPPASTGLRNLDEVV